MFVIKWNPDFLLDWPNLPIIQSKVLFPGKKAIFLAIYPWSFESLSFFYQTPFRSWFEKIGIPLYFVQKKVLESITGWQKWVPVQNSNNWKKKKRRSYTIFFQLSFSPADSLSLSLSGEFRIPSSTPTELIVDFLVKHKQKALDLHLENER